MSVDVCVYVCIHVFVCSCIYVYMYLRVCVYVYFSHTFVDSLPSRFVTLRHFFFRLRRPLP